jgi:type IV pilus assembly protein PilW
MSMEKIMKSSDMPTSEKGFTILELLVAMTISLVVMGAVYSTYRSQQNSYIIQDQVAGAQQNLRAAMYSLTRDLRMAGFNGNKGAGNSFGITVATGNTVTFTSDNGAGSNYGNGAVDSDETITYSIDTTDPNNHKLMRNAGGGNQVLAENIVAVGFSYAFDQANDGAMDITANNNIIWAVDTDADNQLDLMVDTDDDGVIARNDDTDSDGTIDGVALATQVQFSRIESVKIWLLARTAQPTIGYQDNNRYVVGRTVITPQAGYRYRLLTETAKCRNLSL